MCIYILVGGFNLSEKNKSKWECSPNRGKKKKYLKPSPSIYIMYIYIYSIYIYIYICVCFKTLGPKKISNPSKRSNLETCTSNNFQLPPRMLVSVCLLIPSIGLVYTYLHCYLFFMVNVGKYTFQVPWIRPHALFVFFSFAQKVKGTQFDASLAFIDSSPCFVGFCWKLRQAPVRLHEEFFKAAGGKPGPAAVS